MEESLGHENEGDSFSPGSSAGLTPGDWPLCEGRKDLRIHPSSNRLSLSCLSLEDYALEDYAYKISWKHCLVMDQDTRIETRMILGSERCFEAESGMRREGVKGWVVFRS